MRQITIGRLRGGFCVRWTDDTGRTRRYQLAARTRAEAEGEARDVYLRHSAPPAGSTVAALWTAYVAHLGAKPTATTMRWTGKAVLARFGALRPDQIGIDDCRAYAAQRLAQGRAVGAIHTELGHLRSCLTWAARCGLIDRAPHIERPPKPDSTVGPLSDAQMRALIDGADTPHIRLSLILLFATAARVGAILDLTWDRVDFARGVIDLRRGDGVTRKGRAVVPINRMAMAALQSAYAGRLTDHVIEWNGRPVRQIRKGFAAAARRAGLTGVHIHQIRHTAAVRMLAAGIPLSQVSQMLGHSDERVTRKVYARFLPEHLAAAAEVLDISRFGEPRHTSLKGRK